MFVSSQFFAIISQKVVKDKKVIEYKSFDKISYSDIVLGYMICMGFPKCAASSSFSQQRALNKTRASHKSSWHA